jgi:hypothetical protein
MDVNEAAINLLTSTLHFLQMKLPNSAKLAIGTRRLFLTSNAQYNLSR